MDVLDKGTLNILEKIYQQQHFFIDRHDSMAEKFMNVLLIEATCFMLFFSIRININADCNPSLIQTVLLVLFLIFFIVTLCRLYFVVRPLSTKAREEEDESLIRAENKKWILNSSIYYQGIVKQIKTAEENEKIPSEEYLSHLSDSEIGRDYLQQIFILAQYNVYKKTKLEAVLKWIIATTIVGGIAAFSFVVNIDLMSLLQQVFAK